MTTTMTASEAKQVADTILEQLGGRRFLAMTGAKNLTFSADGSLNFQLPARGSKKYIKITLNAQDLYTVEFLTMKRNFEIVRDTVENVYFDQLQALFTEKTGLYTSL